MTDFSDRALVRRLVVTGKDTPENIAKLLGPTAKNEIKTIHKEIRLEVLLRPEQGSSMWAMTARDNLDKKCPPQTPRPASSMEEQEVRKVRNMQETIRNHMGARGVLNISTGDMQNILETNLKVRWIKELQTYQALLSRIEGKMKEIQENIRSLMGASDMTNFSRTDLQDRLGDRLAEEMQIYQTALNAMDQGLRVDQNGSENS